MANSISNTTSLRRAMWSCPLCNINLNDHKMLQTHYIQELRNIDALGKELPSIIENNNNNNNINSNLDSSNIDTSDIKNIASNIDGSSVRGAAKRAQKQIHIATQTTRARRKSLLLSLDFRENALRDTKTRRKQRRTRLLENSKKVAALSAAVALETDVPAYVYSRNFGGVDSLNTAVDPNSNDPSCFMCGMKLEANDAFINEHISQCLENSNTTFTSAASQEASNINQDTLKSSSDDWTEYEIAGQRRIRATALMKQESGDEAFSAAGFITNDTSSVPKKPLEDEDDVDIDIEIEEDEEKFGTAQYSETDLKKFSTVDIEEDSTDSIENSEFINSIPNGSIFESNDTSSNSFDDNKIHSGGNVSSLIIDSLRSKIKELESRNTSKGSNSGQCLICLSNYTEPLVSVVCWHVHCKECWMQSLATKRVCPQCQCITAPHDLRRVYI